MNLVLINGGLVVNIIEADAAFVAANPAYVAAFDDYVLSASVPCAIGDTYLGGSSFGPPPDPSLEDAKAAKFVSIDAHTDALISQGFVYGGKSFSLSMESQTRTLGIVTFKDVLTYPVNYNTIDDLDALSIVDVAMVDAFAASALGTLRYYLDSGTALKDLVRAATTIAEINAIIDER